MTLWVTFQLCNSMIDVSSSQTVGPWPTIGSQPNFCWVVSDPQHLYTLYSYKSRQLPGTWKDSHKPPNLADRPVLPPLSACSTDAGSRPDSPHVWFRVRGNRAARWRKGEGGERCVSKAHNMMWLGKPSITMMCQAALPAAAPRFLGVVGFLCPHQTRA